MLLARAYQKAFDSRPCLTLATANGLLSTLADCIAQSSQIIRSDHLYDPKRSARFFAFGVLMGPIMGRWNSFLEVTFPLRSFAAPKVNPLALAKRVALDQLFMAPIGIAVFIGAMGLMEGRTNKQIATKYNLMFSSALVANWKVWPIAQLVNFRYVPLAYRVPFSQTCGVFWNLYLSLLNAKEKKKQDTLDCIHNS